MNQSVKKILTINPGSTSTKLALFENETEVLRKEILIRSEDIAHCTRMIDQLDIRLASINAFIQEAGIDLSKLDMIVARGGSIHGIRSGAYNVDKHVETILRYFPRSQHVSSLAAIIAYQLSQEYGIPAIFYDAPSADDADEIMHYTGLPESKRFVTSHCLNSKMVARQVAQELGKPYEECNFITAHLGGGITMAFHSGGRMIDTLLDDAGPMSPQRAGRIPVTDVINLCYSGQYTRMEMMNKMRGKGGLSAYFGVQDARDVEAMIAEGNEFARDIYWYMAYQIAKGIGELSVVQKGKIDRIILTGGMAYSKMLTDWIIDRVSFLAPVVVVPGEREMEALALGGLRVLRGEEPVKTYTWLPEGYDSFEQLLEDCDK
ncbi:MAG: butyrate kinase [Oscillospiraceae bacterium]|nr:butyrate kinase [Oscillospiraceae bacterium]